MTQLGYVALGAVPKPYDMSWVSADGIAWIQLPVLTEPGVDGPAIVADGPAIVADGPAGVIGISYPDDSGDIVLPGIVLALS